MRTYRIKYRTGEKNYLGTEIVRETTVQAKDREAARQTFEHKIFLPRLYENQAKPTRYSRTAIVTMNIEK